MTRMALLATTILAMAGPSATLAADVEIRMLNKGAEGLMVFEPSFVRIAPGDTVRFVATDKGHNVEAIDAMVPAGGKPFVGKMNEELAVTFEVPGIYGYRCKPHYPMGMVGMIVVGDPTNLEQVKTVGHPGKAKQVFGALFDKLVQSTAAAK